MYTPSPCVHDPRVVRSAARALCSLTLKNQANKTRCASLDAVSILLELAAAWGVAEDDGECHPTHTTYEKWIRIFFPVASFRCSHCLERITRLFREAVKAPA